MHYIQREVLIYFKEFEELIDFFSNFLETKEKVNYEFLSSQIQFEKLKQICSDLSSDYIMKNYGKALIKWLNESKSYHVNDNIIKGITYFGKNFLFDNDRNAIRNLIEIQQILMSKISLHFKGNEEFEILQTMFEKLKKIV